ncbi:hypothetical protein FOVG_16457 [Fusarium oxysporum f. sp. pisi HDV247]|uniref:Uncharacterized protein n=2 Tax=Fusarium oxysporum TaxID=5507 RepID=X0LJM5_FUSOX|nr:hypothetical protein FOVG_16457 [Fusarium oxysporum f. sp. pisi HDV247]EXM26098.1 hypothetical protein FOTG_07123 [Fusarium oxysporum f. sp. vasinfectum 25433]
MDSTPIFLIDSTPCKNNKHVTKAAPYPYEENA